MQHAACIVQWESHQSMMIAYAPHNLAQAAAIVYCIMMVHPSIDYVSSTAACKQTQTSFSTTGRGLRQSGRQASTVSLA